MFAALLAMTTPAFCQTIAERVSVPVVDGMRVLGPVADARPIALAFSLRVRDEAALEALVRAQSDPNSREYRRFLTSDEWNARFAPTEADVGAVTAALSRTGMRVTEVAANRGIVDAVADAATVARVFGTRLEAVAHPLGGERFRNATPATIPAELAPYVRHVAGLSNFPVPRPPHPLSVRANHALAGASASGPLNGPDGGYGPGVISIGYDYPAQHGSDGRGSTAGILIAGDWLNRDLATYLGYFKVKHTGTIARVKIDGGYTAGPSEIETTLDVETVASLAPGANIVVYEFPDFVENYIDDALNRLVADNKVDSFSGSWGYCETVIKGLGGWDPAVLHTLFLEAVAKGITPIYSSGDDGAFTRGCNGKAAVSNPASDPTVVAVGGTKFFDFVGGKFVDQVGWQGSGGGVSTLFARPDYQAGISNTDARGRNVPDVALPGAQEDSFYFSPQIGQPIDGWATVGGTSWAAPAFNALVAEIVEVRGHRLGSLNPDLYSAAASFTDVTRGNDGKYVGRVGYDYLTGLGTPKGQKLATQR